MYFYKTYSQTSLFYLVDCSFTLSLHEHHDEFLIHGRAAGKIICIFIFGRQFFSSNWPSCILVEYFK